MSMTKYVVEVRFPGNSKTYEYECTYQQYRKISEMKSTIEGVKVVVDTQSGYKITTVVGNRTVFVGRSTKATKNIVSIIDDVDYIQSSPEYLKKENKRLKKELKDLRDSVRYSGLSTYSCTYTGGNFQNFSRDYF